MCAARLGTVALAAAAACISLGAAGAKQLPGTAPAGGGAPGIEAAPRAEVATGLKVFYRKFGEFRLSVDAAGSNAASHVLLVNKPDAAAVVEKAYLMAASNFQATIANGDVRLDGKPVSWMSATFNDIPPDYPKFFHNVLADVTSIVKPKVDAKPTAGTVQFTAAENAGKNGSIDGEILAVVFRVPKAEKRTVVLMFGAQQLAGDRFELTLAESIDPTAKDAWANMGLGISFSAQPTGQYSQVDVNGKRLTTSAGGQDDGSMVNGALITAGGIGDSRANPPDPNALPTDSRTDDEMYSLLKFITKSTRAIHIDTVNPSNDDNILFAWFDISAKGDVNKDTDGDGLLDAWETSGYDHDGDGVVDVPIHKRGANPKRKDIFIAYAWMNKSNSEAQSHQPSAAVLKAVVDAFKKAPVSNPDGSTGITVHFKNLGGVPHDEDLNPVWTEFDAIMNPKVSEAERRIYHRLLNGHAYSNTSSSGLSRGIPASDFIETLGRWSSNPGTFKQRAGTIMHELGHNLGLRHGGVDHINYKPNHLSIMSYLNQMDWVLKSGSGLLDYERFNIKDLNEASLKEPAGLDRVGGDGPITAYGTRWYKGGALQFKPSGADKNIDWNKNGTATDVGISVDLNNSGGLSVLRGGFPEWANVIFDGGEIGAGAPTEKKNMITSPEDLIELTFEEYERLLKAPDRR
jgi:hypothetical protein